MALEGTEVKEALSSRASQHKGSKKRWVRKFERIGEHLEGMRSRWLATDADRSTAAGMIIEAEQTLQFAVRDIWHQRATHYNAVQQSQELGMKQGEASAECAPGGFVRRATTLRRVEKMAMSPPEMGHPVIRDNNDEMVDQDHPMTPTREAEPSHPNFPELRELSRENLSQTISFIPRRMKKRFARIRSSKMDELTDLMRREEDTQERERNGKLAGFWQSWL